MLHLEALVRYGTISPEDLDLIQYADDPATALKLLQEGLTKYYLGPEAPERGPVPELPEL